eukprot:1611243-Rhodomonas_salina.1
MYSLASSWQNACKSRQRVLSWYPAIVDLRVRHNELWAHTKTAIVLGAEASHSELWVHTKEAIVLGAEAHHCDMLSTGSA